MSEAALPTPISVYAPAERAGGVPPADGPVQPAERLGLLDVLRGFALLGILQVNFLSFGGNADRFFDFIISGTFITIFGFLFGLGFAIQGMRAQAAGRPFVLRHLWRMLLLFGIGALHFAFWSGDVVRTYALVGVLLLLFMRWRPAPLLVAATILIALEVTPIPTSPPGGPLWMRPDPEQAEAQRIATSLRNENEVQYRLWRQGADDDGLIIESMRAGFYRLRAELSAAYRPRFFLGHVYWLGVFLLGLYAGRRRIFHDPARHRGLLLGVLGTSLLVGIAGNAISAYTPELVSLGLPLEGLGSWRYVIQILGNLSLALFYIAALTLLYSRHERVRRTLAPLGSVGRMPLTNYIMQSVIITMLLWPRGLDLAEHIGPWWRLLLLNVVFVGQVLYSRWWFQRFEFGPVEWAWRSLTWFRLQPLRRVEVRASERVPGVA